MCRRHTCECVETHFFFFKDTGGLCRRALSRQNIFDFPSRNKNDFQEMPTETLMPKLSLWKFPPWVDPCIIFIWFFLGHLGLFPNSLPFSNKLYSYRNTPVNVFQDHVIPLWVVWGNPLPTWFTKRRWLVILELLLMPPDIFLSTLKESGIIL